MTWADRVDRCAGRWAVGPRAIWPVVWPVVWAGIAVGAAGRSCRRPAPSRGPAQPEHAEPGKVDRGSQQAEVRGHLGPAPHPGAAAAVAAAHQMAEFAFDLGAGGRVVGAPGRIGLAGAGGGQQGLVRTDGDGPAALGAGAAGGQGAGGAGRAEGGLAGVALGAGGADRHGDATGAGDGASGQVDGEAVFAEAVFAEVAADRRWRLDLDHRGDVDLVQAFQQVPGAVGGVAVDRRLLAGFGFGFGFGG